MHLLKMTLLVSIVIFFVISLSNKVLTKRKAFNKHSTTDIKYNKHKKNHFLKTGTKLHHIHTNNNKQQAHHGLKFLHHRQVQEINPILHSKLCPISHTPRIVDGWTANDTSFSHAAVLYTCNATALPSNINGCEHMCGGSIISQIHILTAAHCVFDDDKLLMKNDELYVRIHAKDLSKPDNNMGPYRTTLQTKRIFVHPGYDKDDDKSLDDIAIIKLVQTMLNVVPICIAGLHFNYDLAARPNVIVAGWGYVASGGPLSNVLKYAYLYVSNCGPYNAKEFCAIAPYLINGHICDGDSGSGVLPLTQNRDAINLIVGLVASSSASNSSDCETPDFYTNVTTYAWWINYIVAF